MDLPGIEYRNGGHRSRPIHVGFARARRTAGMGGGTGAYVANEREGGVTQPLKRTGKETAIFKGEESEGPETWPGCFPPRNIL